MSKNDGKVSLDLSDTDNGGASVTVSDGIETVTYKPSAGRVRVEPGHLGAVLGAIPGARLADGEEDPAGTPPGDDNGSGTA